METAEKAGSFQRNLQNYAVWAKNNLENQIEIALKTLGINSENDIREARKVGDYTIIDGDSNSYPGELNQVLISMLLVYNESFSKWFTRKGIKTRLVDNQNFWFANYHVILTYYKKGLTSEKMLSKYICKYLIPLKYHDEAKKLMIEFYYQNIVAKNPFVASICEISDSITEYLLQRNHVKNDAVVDENEQDYQEIIDFDF